MPYLTWQPSDPDPELRASIRAWIAQTGVSNPCAPLDLDVCWQPWRPAEAEAVVCINMIHIAPWSAAAALMAGAARIFPPTGALVLYGPYRREGPHAGPPKEALAPQIPARQPRLG